MRHLSHAARFLYVTARPGLYDNMIRLRGGEWISRGVIQFKTYVAYTKKRAEKVARDKYKGLYPRDAKTLFYGPRSGSYTITGQNKLTPEKKVILLF